MSQPPSFEPSEKKQRPSSEGARLVASTSDQLDEWASLDSPSRPPARRSMLEDELGMEPGEADPHGPRGDAGGGGAAGGGASPVARGSAARTRRGGHAAGQEHAAGQGHAAGEAGAAIPASYPPGQAASGQAASYPPRQASAQSPSSSRSSSSSGVPGAAQPSASHSPHSAQPANQQATSYPVSYPPRGSGSSPAPASSPSPTPAPSRPASQPAGGGGTTPAGPPSGLPPSRPRRRRRWGRRIFVALLVLVIAIVAWPFYLIHYGNSKLEHVDALSDREGTPGTTYLIVGSDKRQAGGIEDGAQGERADTMMLMHVPESGNAALVSLPRDTYVTIPGHGDDKLNAAYAAGGPKLLVATVEELSGMTIDHYVEVSMGGVKDLVDAVGGVNLCLDYDVSDENSGLYWQAGCHDADGTTALAFSRMRYSDPLGDIGRTMRQRQVVSKLVSKVASPSTLINPLKQRRLVGSAASNLTTSEGTGLVNLGRAGLALRGVMGEGGLVGAPPIASLNYRVRGQSAVLLDPNQIDSFFEKMKNGTLTSADFYTPPGM